MSERKKLDERRRDANERREAAIARLQEWDCDDFEADLRASNLYPSYSALVNGLWSSNLSVTATTVDGGHAIHGQGRTWTVLESDSGYTIFLTRVHEGEVVSERIGEASEWVKAYGQALNAASGNGFEL